MSNVVPMRRQEKAVMGLCVRFDGFFFRFSREQALEFASALLDVCFRKTRSTGGEHVVFEFQRGFVAFEGPGGKRVVTRMRALEVARALVQNVHRFRIIRGGAALSAQPALIGLESFVEDFGDDLDFYETPRWAVDAIIPHLRKIERCHLIEPAAGRGALLAPAIAAFEPAIVSAYEIHEGRFDELVYKTHGVSNIKCVRGDFLSLPVPRNESRIPRVVLMNPPYSKPRETIGLEFVERAVEWAGDDGIVAALLPLDFATGVSRCERIHDKHHFSVYPLRRRPHFGGEGNGARPFAWFVRDGQNDSQHWRVVG